MLISGARDPAGAARRAWLRRSAGSLALLAALGCCPGLPADEHRPDLRAVTLTIVDPAGHPVAAADVRLYDERGGWSSGARERSEWTTTDAGGVARLTDIDASVGWTLYVGAPPAAADRLADHIQERWRPADRTLALAAARTLTGMVVDSAGAPAPYAQVYVRLANDRLSDLPAGQADGKGHFRLPRMPDAPLTLAAKESEDSFPKGASTAVPQGASDVRVALDHAAKLLPPALRVHVVTPDGTPVCGGSVHFDWTERSGGSQASVGSGRDLDGAWIAEHDVSHPWMVTVGTCWDRMGEALPFTGVSAGPFTGPGEVEVTLGPAQRMTARVLGPDGRGLPHARVQAHPVGAAMELPRQVPESWRVREAERALYSGVRAAWGMTDREGRVLLTSLSKREYLLWVRPPDGDYLSPQALRVPWNAAEPVVRVTSTPPVEIRVVDAKGAPLHEATVGVQSHGMDDHHPCRRWPLVRTDAQGRALLRGLDPKLSCTLWVSPAYRKAGDGRNLLDARRESWTPAATTVTLLAGRRIHGVVKDAAGKPVPGAIVLSAPVGDAPGGQWSAQADDDGTYEIGPVPVGKRRIVAGVPRRPRTPGVFRGEDMDHVGPYKADEVPARLWTDVPEGDAPLDLVAVGPDSITVRITGWSAKAKGAQLLVRKEGAEASAVSVRLPIGRDGVVEVRDLDASATYVLWVGPLPGGQVCFRAGVRVAEGDVTLSVGPGGHIKGRLKGPPNVAARKVWLDVHGLVVEGRLIGPAGEFDIAGVPEGTWTVRASARAGSVVLEGHAESGAGRVEIELRPK